MYCFGPSKAKDIVKTYLELDKCDSLYMEQSKQVMHLEKALNKADSAIVLTNLALSASESISGQKDIQLSDRNQKLTDCEKEVKKQKRKRTVWTITSIIQTVGITAGAILILKK